MKATDLLKRQQLCIAALLAQVEAGQSEAFVQLAHVFAAHAASKRELFYPVVFNVAQPEVLEAFEKQAQAERAVRRARAAGKTYAGHVEALASALSAFFETEQRCLFPCVDRKLSNARLQALGEQLDAGFLAALQGLWRTTYSAAPRRPSATRLTRIARARATPSRWAVERRQHLKRSQSEPPTSAHLEQYWQRVA